jgi:predicted cobalt transporter CbtA
MRVTWPGSRATRPLVTQTKTGAVLRAAVLAGLIAGAIASAFHLVLAEPLIERAIALDAQARAEHGGNAETPVVSRPVQKTGLVVGLLVYGLVWGVLFAVVYLVLESRRGLRDIGTSGWLLALLLGWSVAWFPFLKYPANPPGVGEAATIGYRQLLYVGFIALSAAGVAVAFLFHLRAPRQSALGGRRRRSIIAVYAIYAAVLYLAMPRNPDSMLMPMTLVWTFRAVSFAGMVVFWVALGGSFTWLTRVRA